MDAEIFEPIYFDSGPPSNFHIAPFWLPDPIRDREREYKGVEWWFQAYKVFISDESSWEMYEEIMEADTAFEAKRLGKAVPLTSDQLRYWDGFLAVCVMLEGCLAKFWQNEECRQWIVKTGKRPLIEHRPDKAWGDNMDGSGRNLLGKILEVVRAQVS